MNIFYFYYCFDKMEKPHETQKLHIETKEGGHE